MTALNKPLPHPSDPWDARFGFFWYNDQEIFHDTEADLDRKAEAVAQSGINHVITFSVAHFRWSFHAQWPLLTETLAKIVRACHRYGIYVTEHHSTHLTFNPANEEEEVWTDQVFAARASKRESWGLTRGHTDADPIVIDNVRLSALRQIDGRTGQPARSRYRGWCHCFNNPDYRRAYLAYLETLYATGIDGIMTDDVQWFGDGHACACPHCRRLFREQYSYELPQPGAAWNAWWGDYGQASYRAWLDFRLRSTESFAHAVVAHYTSLGLRPLRPNYTSHALINNWTGYTLETLPHLDWVFQESCHASVIRYDWPAWAQESAHRFAVARRRVIPAMDIFYPDRPDSMRFCWALAQSWGVLYLATPEGGVGHQDERELRDFERAHARLLRRPTKIARLAFYDSRRVREQYKDLDARTLPSLKQWMQACYTRNLPYDLFQREELARLAGYDVVVLNEVGMLSAEEVKAFADFARCGGTLVWIGRSGAYDERGADRLAEELGRLFGLPSLRAKEDGESVETLAVGQGKLALIPLDWNQHQINREYQVYRLEAGRREPYTPPSAADEAARDRIVAYLSGLLPGGPELVAEKLPQGIIATLFQSEDGKSLVVHLLNTTGTLEMPAEGKIGHTDRIPFPSHAGKPEAILYIKRPRGSLRPARSRTAMLHRLNHAPISAPREDAVEHIVLRLDPAWMDDYALIEI